MTQSIRFALLALAAATVGGCDSMSPNASISQVVVAPSSATISTGQSIHLSATVTAVPAASEYAVQWTSSDINATVDSTGLVVGVNGSPGVSICATASAAGSSMKSCATVVVSPAPLCPGPTGLLTPSSDTLHVGDVAPFQIPPAQLFGRSASQFRWTVDSKGPVTVDSLTGVATAVSAGGTDVIATDQLLASCPHEWRAVVIVH
jgi:uncharacterized protein YjdB